MAYNQAFQHPTEDLFLDILTKEEREALLNKKMEEIRKKNEALRKRHEEIEADKLRAEKLSKPVGSPKKESKPFPGEEKPVRPRGRGKPQSARSPKDRPPLKSQGRGSRRRQENQANGVNIGRIPPERHMYCDRLHVTDDHDEEKEEEERVDISNQRFHNKSFGNGRGNDNSPGYQRQNSIPNKHDPHSRNHQEHEDFQNSVNQTSHNNSQYSGRLANNESGPPPDPAFNFLSDRGREGQGQQEPARDQSRRHPKNFGGTEFKNVTMKMKLQKDKQDGGFKGGPNSPMDMSLSMTGRERRQYTEWKAEREKVDQDRIHRQKSSSGEWRRAWDAEKLDRGLDDDDIPQRSEPARRPAGRIGSGRFVHSERLEERQRGEAPGPRVYSSERGKPSSAPRGRGRGWGRGRGRGQRVRSTSSGSDDQSRKVEQKEDLLVVKFDNSPGDQSVEVEYDEINHKKKRNGDKSVNNNKSASQERNLNQNGRNRSKRKSPPKHTTPAKHESGEEYWEDDIFADAELQVHQGSPEYGLGDLQPEIRIKEPTPVLEGSGAPQGSGEYVGAGSIEDSLDDKYERQTDEGDEYMDDNPAVDGTVNNRVAKARAPGRIRSKSSHSVSTGASDEWEDIPEDDEFYNMDESFGDETEESEPSPPSKQKTQQKVLPITDGETDKPDSDKDQTGAEIKKTAESKKDVDSDQKKDVLGVHEKTPSSRNETQSQRESLKINVDLKTPEGKASGEQFLSPISPFKTPTGVTKVVDWAAEMDKFGSPITSPNQSPKKNLNFEESPKQQSTEIKDVEQTYSEESSLIGGDTSSGTKDPGRENVSVPHDDPSENQCAGNAESFKQTDKQADKQAADTVAAEVNDQNVSKESSKTEESPGEITQPYSDPVKKEDFVNEKSFHEELQDFIRKDTRKGSLPEPNQ